ncbi:hypothetical protein LUZ63_008117 [Rhynchospora breviuscula]|uniref:AB hydrolase-1 domain-containing protein n=1 Tax=Rhynchospora breviuscula TaxID=2022672 RepID=A0A9Q0CTI6_9POAL|nr:hypothetical protein LUZ63_008117 [Rhynchospora breviuscula]
MARRYKMESIQTFIKKFQFSSFPTNSRTIVQATPIPKPSHTNPALFLYLHTCQPFSPLHQTNASFCQTTKAKPTCAGIRRHSTSRMACCVSITACCDRYYDATFSAAGLRPSVVSLSDGTSIHLWSPQYPNPSSRRALVLIHGFGASATWQWAPYLRPLIKAGFDLYVPDLIFFGGSFSPSPDRSDYHQARSVVGVLDRLGVSKFGLVGVSYGGFVSYRISELCPERVERVVLICAGVCLEDTDLTKGLFVVSNVADAAELLVPRRPEKLKELVRLTFVKPPRVMPSCFMRDYIQVMCTEYAQEKTELLQFLIQDRKLSNLPKITQKTLILWGEEDKVFPLELAHRLKRHLEENSQLVIIKEAGHAVNLEKPAEVVKNIINFFVEPCSDNSTNDHKE